MTDLIHRSLDEQRTPLLLIGLFATVAAGLCAVGIYGVLAFAVVQRTGEFGVRMALGASRNAIVALVMTDAGRLLGIGLVLGAVLSVGMVWVVRARLFGIDALDPATWVAVGVFVAGIAALASWIPASRAARTPPTQALRYE